MSAYCPECETDLDQATGICPACRWDPIVAAAAVQPAEAPAPELSLTERYRGTNFDVTVQQADAGPSGVSRGRFFVLISLVVGVALYGVTLTLMGPAF